MVEILTSLSRMIVPLTSHVDGWTGSPMECLELEEQMILVSFLVSFQMMWSRYPISFDHQNLSKMSIVYRELYLNYVVCSAWIIFMQDIYEATKFHPASMLLGDFSLMDEVYFSSVKMNISEICTTLQSMYEIYLYFY